ncbi:MAG: GNAT family N-acetyltransferase [Puia sp.]|nr:GNAT family N-acetyltransferase [Puia sp.]
MLIRPAIPEDIPALKVLCYDTITTICARDYNVAQIMAWASAVENGDSIARRFALQYFYIAEAEAAVAPTAAPAPAAAAAAEEEEEAFSDAAGAGTSAMQSFVIGFASLEGVEGKRNPENGRSAEKRNVSVSDLHTGHLDLLYVHKDCQRRGVAGRLLFRILETARELGLTGIDVEASITARPFFEKHNFRMSGEQTVYVKGIALLNYKMHLELI